MGLCHAPISKLACWPCAQALQDRLPSSTRAHIPAGMAAWGMSLVGCTRAHVCWHLASPAVGIQKRCLRPARSSQELDVRAGHPPGGSAPSLLPQHQHLPIYINGTGWMGQQGGEGTTPHAPQPLQCPQLCSQQTELG